MTSNKAEELLLRLRSEAKNRAHSALLAPLAGYGLSLLFLLGVLLRIVPVDIVVALIAALLGPAALTLWAMWRVQEVITDVTGRIWVACGVEPRIIEFQVPTWRIIGGE